MALFCEKQKEIQRIIESVKYFVNPSYKWGFLHNFGLLNF